MPLPARREPRPPTSSKAVWRDFLRDRRDEIRQILGLPRVDDASIRKMFLDFVARSIQPSYYTTSLYRDDSGKWFVHLEVRNGVSKGRRVEWSIDAFRQCVEQLKVFV